MSFFSTSTSAFYERSRLDMTSLRGQAEQIQAQISTGQRLTASSDDPVAASRLRSLARLEKLAGIDTAAADRATGDLGLVDGALSQFADYIVRAQELTTQAASGTLTAQQRAGIGVELAQIHGNLVNLANMRDSAGHALFGGESTGAAYQLDGAGNAVYIGTGSAGELALGDGQTISRSLTGPEFLNFSVGGTPTDLMAVMKSLADALQAGGAGAAAAANSALTALNTGLDTVTTAQTIVGSRLNWIDLTTERHLEMSEQRAAEETDIGSTDVAVAFTRLQELSTVLQASQASFAKLSGLSLFNVLN